MTLTSRTGIGSLLNNRLLQAALAIGICVSSAIAVIALRGGFDQVPQRAHGEPQESDSPGGRITGIDQAVRPGNMPDMPKMYFAMAFTGETVPGVVQPATLPANAASIPDDAPIIGVEVDGHWRAYCVSEMGEPLTHVINDVLGGIPLTVTYCDRNDCAVVFTKPHESGRPLDVGNGGFIDGQLLVYVDHRKYRQNSPELPLQVFRHVRTTWKEWKSAHPDTDICTKLDTTGLSMVESGAPIVPSSAAKAGDKHEEKPGP